MILDAKLEEKNREFRQLTNYELTLKNKDYMQILLNEDSNNMNFENDHNLVKLLKQKIQKLQRDLNKS